MHKLIVTNKFGAIQISALTCPEYQVRTCAMEEIKNIESRKGVNNKVKSAAVILEDGTLVDDITRSIKASEQNPKI